MEVKRASFQINCKDRKHINNSMKLTVFSSRTRFVLSAFDIAVPLLSVLVTFLSSFPCGCVFFDKIPGYGGHLHPTESYRQS